MTTTTIKLQDFQEAAVLGHGTFGICKKVLRKSDGKWFAWKEVCYLHMPEVQKEMLVLEVNLLRQLKHPHIVK